MKRFLSISGLLLSTIVFSQVIINPGTKTTVTNSSVSLEFGSEERGIILPYVASPDALAAVPGTFIMDPQDKVMKVKLGNGSWQDLTGNAAKTQSLINPFDTYIEQPSAKSIIGPTTVSQAQVAGILILSDPNKAMILPQVPSPHLNIKNPAAGMMVYDTNNKILAVFNGTQWSFWQP